MLGLLLPAVPTVLPKLTLLADLDTGSSTLSAWELDGNGDAMPVNTSFHDMHYDLDTNDDIMPALIHYFVPDTQGDLQPTG
jgi:hypothetical protein